MQPGVEMPKSDHGSLSCDKIETTPLSSGCYRREGTRNGQGPLVIDLIAKANGNLAGETGP
jgi:hypothetical protein